MRRPLPSDTLAFVLESGSLGCLECVDAIEGEARLLQ
jgi:hypothetical protein